MWSGKRLHHAGFPSSYRVCPNLIPPVCSRSQSKLSSGSVLSVRWTKSHPWVSVLLKITCDSYVWPFMTCQASTTQCFVYFSSTMHQAQFRGWGLKRTVRWPCPWRAHRGDECKAGWGAPWWSTSSLLWKDLPGEVPSGLSTKWWVEMGNSKGKEKGLLGQELGCEASMGSHKPPAVFPNTNFKVGEQCSKRWVWWGALAKPGLDLELWVMGIDFLLQAGLEF